jgi:glucokinase
MDGVLAVDAGGTYTKYLLTTTDGRPLTPEIAQIAACPDGTADDIARAYRALSARAAEQAQGLGLRIARVSVCTPGPFDMDRGCPLMRHKFAAVYGQSVVPWLMDSLPGVPVHFLHDSTATLIGEARLGAGRGSRNPACVMLGTGFGFAVMREGRVLVNERRAPALSLWNRAFRGGIVEDTLSRRGIRAAYAARTGLAHAPDVRDLADAARMGDAAAREIFLETGAALAELMGPILTELDCDRLILGGQIAGAADLFGAYERALPCPAALSAMPERAGVLGAALFRPPASDFERPWEVKSD